MKRSTCKRNDPGSIERVLVYVLRGGVTLSFALMLLGILMLHARAPEAQNFMLPIRLVFTGLKQLRPMALINLGILTLLVTPLVRVIASVVGFAAQKDWLFSAISLVVLVILLFSMVIGAY